MWYRRGSCSFNRHNYFMKPVTNQKLYCTFWTQIEFMHKGSTLSPVSLSVQCFLHAASQQFFCVLPSDTTIYLQYGLCPVVKAASCILFLFVTIHDAMVSRYIILRTYKACTFIMSHITSKILLQTSFEPNVKFLPLFLNRLFAMCFQTLKNMNWCNFSKILRDDALYWKSLAIKCFYYQVLKLFKIGVCSHFYVK